MTDAPPTLAQTPNFLAYLLARFAFGVISRMLVVVVGWQIYDLTNNPLHLGYVGLVMFTPVLFLGLIAGDLADRFDRALLVAAGSLMACAALIGLAVTALLPETSLAAIYICTAFAGVGIALSKPALWALLPQIVHSSQLPAAISSATIATQTSVIMGPALAGVLLMAGIATGYGAAAFFACLTAVLVLRLTSVKPRSALVVNGEPTLSRMMGGIRYIRRTPVILGVVVLDLFAVLLGSVIVLLPVFARDILEVGPAGLGALRAAPAVGALGAAAILTRYTPRRHAGNVMLCFTALFGVAIVVFAVSKNIMLSLAALGVAGAADMISVVIRQSVLQLGTPDEIRGRVVAVSQMFVSGSNELGDFRAGIVAAMIGAVPAAIVGGLSTLVVVAIATCVFPAIRQLTDPRMVEPKPHDLSSK